MLEADREAVVQRERAFHDERFADDAARRRATGRYYAVDAGKPAYADAIAAIPTGAVVLEYGCGTGSAAFDLAARGVDVTGIDISAVAVESARTEAGARGVDPRFVVGDAHALDAADDTYDVVCGSGILHHLDLAVALPEVARVLRPGGTALFCEPLGTNPLINLFRRLTPSLRTPDEHPLVPADVELARRSFGVVEHEAFTFLALAGAVLGRLGPARRLVPTVVPALHRGDRWLFRRLPWTRRLAWVTVLRLSSPLPEPRRSQP